MRHSLMWLLLVALLASCSGAPQPAATPSAIAVATPIPDGTNSDRVTISFAVWDYERSLYQPLVARFEAQNPDIHVVMVPLDDLMRGPMGREKGGPGPGSSTDMLRAIVTGADTAPAIGVSSDAYGTPLLLDLKPLMDADAQFSRDFYPGALEYWSAKGGVWALPRSFYLHVLTYNKDAFEAAGLPAPQNGWSWQDLLAAAEQLGQGSGVNASYGFADGTGGMLPLMVTLETQGIDMQQLSSPDVDLTDDVYATTIERVRALFKSGAIVNPYEVANGGDVQQIFRDGRVALWEQQNYGPEQQLSDVPFRAGTVADPDGPLVTQMMGSGSDGYIISGGTAYPQQAWRWIEFLSRQPIQQGQGPDLRIPARESLAEANGYWNSQDAERVAAYRWALEHTTGQPQATYDYSAMSALSQAMYQAMSDPGSDIDRLLAEAQRSLLDMRAQAETQVTPTPDTRPVLVATPEPQEAPPGTVAIDIPAWSTSPTELRQLTRAFRAQHPEIFVNIKSTDTISGEITLADIAKLGDCFMTMAPSSADVGALLDLRPLIDADTSFNRDVIPPALISTYQFDGGVYGLPYTLNLRTLTYNRTLFEQAGLPLPANNWTPQDFLQAAQALTSGEGNQRRYGYVPLGGAQGDMLFFVNKLGGRLTSGTNLDTRPTFTDPATVAALRWYLDLGMVHKVTPAPSFPYRMDQMYEDHSYELIQGGRAAMWFDYGKGGWGQVEGPVKDGGPGMAPTAVPPASFEVGIAPVLVGDGGLQGNDLTSRGWVISKNAKNPEACWEFIKFA
ncbi:MAG TPA: extracellular solute-binding protein, partial [Roseiflexaceae bacterium]|nr:extracellular solute-binding protein [Roseiflexaceae bacterium]